MRFTLVLAGCLLTVAAFAGCAQAPPPKTSTSPGPAGHEFEENFDTLNEGDRPMGWGVDRGTWGAHTNLTDTAHPRVMRGAGDGAEPGVSSLVASQGSYTDVEIFLKFKMVSGDAGAGLVLHYVDEKNYEIVRYSIRENDWHLFTMVDGNRQKQSEGSVGGNYTHPDLGQWVTMRVESRGGHVEAFQDAVKVISYDLQPDASKSGRVGLFVRADMVADFDDLEVEP